MFETGMESEFAFAQFHFHSPSEHTINGVHYDLEMHMVHTYLDGSLGAVIGIMFDRNMFDAQFEGEEKEHTWFLDQIADVFDH